MLLNFVKMRRTGILSPLFQFLDDTLFCGHASWWLKEKPCWNVCQPLAVLSRLNVAHWKIFYIFPHGRKLNLNQQVKFKPKQNGKNSLGTVWYNFFDQRILWLRVWKWYSVSPVPLTGLYSIARAPEMFVSTQSFSKVSATPFLQISQRYPQIKSSHVNSVQSRKQNAAM